MKRSRPGQYGCLTFAGAIVAIVYTTLIPLLLPIAASGQTPTPTPQCNPTPTLLAPCGRPPAASGPVTHTITSCSGLQNHPFASDQHIVVSIALALQPCGLGNTLLIGSTLQNVFLNGGGLTVRPTVAEKDFLHIEGDNIAVANFHLVRNFDADIPFRFGVHIRSGADRASVEAIDVDHATTNAGIRITGENVCLRGTTVSGAGTAFSAPANGYTIDTAAAGTLDFRGAIAKENTSDGFAIEHDTETIRTQFINSISTMNRGDGYDVAGPVVEILCSQAVDNGSLPAKTAAGTPTPTPNAGRGIIMFGVPGSPASSTLQIENSVINRSWRVGISAGNVNQTTTNIINCTLVGNNRVAHQVQDGKEVNVYNTIAVGTGFIRDSAEVNCGYNNLFVDERSCSGTGTIREMPVFTDGSSTQLAGETPGVDYGVDDGVNPASVGVPVIIAHRQDANGVPRPVGSGYDMGAFEAATATWTPPVPFTATRTHTRTNTPLGTPTPCAASCPGACVGDCDCNGPVEISDLIRAVSIALGRIPISCCSAIDVSPVDGMVGINELITAVNSSLMGCSMAQLASLQELGTAVVKIGSAVGVPGGNIEFTVDILDGASQPAGVSVDLVVPTFGILQRVINPPKCVLEPRLATAGLRLMTSELGGFPGFELITRLLVSQASQSAGEMVGMEFPSATIPDGAFARCTATINSNADPGHVEILHGGLVGESDVAPASVCDTHGDSFNAIVVDGAIVINGTTPPNSSYGSQSVPTTMTAGQEYTVSVTMNNTGTKVWTSFPLPQYSLGSMNPQNNVTWGMDRVSLASGEAIETGVGKTFTWNVTAPSMAGTYNFQWRMVQDGATDTWFGATTPNVVVTVECGGCGCP